LKRDREHELGLGHGSNAKIVFPNELLEDSALALRSFIDAGPQRRQVSLDDLDRHLLRRHRRTLAARLGGLGVDAGELVAELPDALDEDQVALAILGQLNQPEVFGERQAHFAFAPLEHADASSDVGHLGGELRP